MWWPMGDKMTQFEDEIEGTFVDGHRYYCFTTDCLQIADIPEVKVGFQFFLQYEIATTS